MFIDAEGSIIVAESKAGSLCALARSSQPTPVMSPISGSTNNAMAVTFSTSLPLSNAPAFHYTLDGSLPTKLSPSGTSAAFDGAYSSNGFRTVRMRCFSPDLATSTETSNTYTFYVSAPDLSPAGGTNNNPIAVTLTNATIGAAIYWTLDGTEPSATNGTLYTAPVTMASNGIFKATGLKSGYTNSVTASQTFVFVPDMPIINAASTGSNDIPIALSCTTTNTLIYYTIDGTDPTTASTPYVGTFLMPRNGTIKARAYRSGFFPSAIASTNIVLTVADPQCQPSAATGTNQLTVTLADATTNAILRYTLDGSTPTTNSPVYSNPLVIKTNTLLSAIAFRDGCTTSAVITNQFYIQVDTPIIDPPSGFFPNGTWVTLSVQRTNASIYYTTNGADPANTDTLYTGPFQLARLGTGSDMRIVKARAFAPSTLASAVAQGQAVASNIIGVPADMVGGIGASLVVPIVIDLAADQQVKSLQFRFEVTPSSPNAPPLTNFLEHLTITATNDFVTQGLGSADNNPITNYVRAYINGTTNGIELYSWSENLLFIDFSSVLNLKLKVPNTANGGDTYKLSVLAVSATSDGQQTTVKISPMVSRTLTVSNISYMAGDASPGAWYNAGDFGNGTLDNADLNVAINASLGIRVPYDFSDAFNAMDVYPEGPGIIGDGMISYLDWEHILQRSLGLETNNWVRFWTPGGILGHRQTTPQALVQAQARTTAVSDAQILTTTTQTATNLWLRHALIAAQTVTNQIPGAQCSVPVYIQVLPGFSVAGLQFRAVCTPVDGAPAPATLRFASAGWISAVMAHALSASNQAACIWPLDSLSKPLQGSNLLGYIQFQIPTNAQSGQRYNIQLLSPDGAADYQTQLSLESASGAVWVQSAPTTIGHTVSEQWKTNFFTSVDNTNADSEADPDRDGAPNWQEYLAGTNPTNALSRLQFSQTDIQAGQITLQWQAAAGRTYIIESASTLAGAVWTPLTTNGFTQDQTGSINQPAPVASNRFYRIRLLQP